MDISRVKNLVFGEVNKHAKEMIERQYQNKAYKFSVAELNDGTLEDTITYDEYNHWPAVYAFF